LTVADPAAPVVRLPRRVDPQAATAITVVFHLTPALAMAVDSATALAISGAGMWCLVDWLPKVAAWSDSSGSALVPPLARLTVRFELPGDFAAISAGRLAADFTAGYRHRVTWVTEDSPPSVPAFVVGRLRRVAVRSSPTLTVHVWAPEADSAHTGPTTGALIETVRDAWTFNSRAFGRLTVGDIDIALSDVPGPRVAGATLFLSPGAPADSVRVAVARMWWGETVRFAGPGAARLAEALSQWSVFQLRAAVAGDSLRQRLVREAEARREPVAALESARRIVGDASFRTALRTFFLEHRRTPATSTDFLALFGAAGLAALAPLIQ
jgi:hypothetical protein